MLFSVFYLSLFLSVGLLTARRAVPDGSAAVIVPLGCGFGVSLLAVLRRLAALREETGIEFIPSLMSQFTPFYKAAEHGLGRRITTYEYRQVIDEAVRLGLTDGYMQEKSSAREEYTPPFDLEGV